ncbi:hypothetical protein HJG60_010832 [Phyllostomus discolor]|uniref:Uncharacterized protein n=1 Tax=Phyllostomus discolor TaxID=89673 RepID=A0A834EA86_9CHIR|nr:hypothetical protein HJG60_010832 [Phyllostomus discolor]
MASWFDGLSSSLGCYLGPMSHGVVSFTRHISRCTKDVWMMESKTEESNELRRKEVETTKETLRPKVERLMTFYNDLDLENKQETAAHNDLIIKRNLNIKLFIGKETLVTQKLLNLQEDIQSVNVAAGFIPVVSSTSWSENIDPKSSEYKHELEQKNLEVKILRERHEGMKRKLFKLQKATEPINGAAGLIPAMPSSISLGDNMDPKASEYEQLEQQNLEMKILRGRNVAMKHKLLKLRKAAQCLNVAAGLIPAMSSTSPGENSNPNTSQYEHELEQKNLEVKILRGRNIAMKHKLLKLQKATQCLNAAAGLIPTMPVSNSLGDNIDHNSSEYKKQLEQQNLEMRILRGRNVAMKDKLLKLQKATESLNAAAGLLPAMSSASLGESTDPSASEYEYELEQQNLKVRILRGRNVRMKQKLLKLQKATQCLNVAAGLLPTMSSASLAENIDPNAPEYECELQQKNMEVKILRGRNVAMKHKFLKVQKATQCLNAAAGLLPAMSSASLAENIDPNTSQCEHELEQKNLEIKILRGRNVAMKHKLFKLRKATQCLNAAAGLEPAMSLSILLSDNINHNAPEYKNQLEQQNLKMKTLRRRNVAMKQKLLKLQKATECLNAAAGLLPAMSSVSQGENIDPNASEYEHELQQKNLEMKIQRGRNTAMKHKLHKLQKATECLNVAAGLLPTMSSASLGENIDPNASEYERELQQKIMEVKILRGRNIAMKYKLLKLRKATECLNVAAGLIPAMSSTSLGENSDPNTSQYEHELEQENLEAKILRGRNVALKHKLLKLWKATQCLNAAAGLIPTMPVSNSLGDNIDHNASEYKNQLEQQNLEMRILRGRNEAMKDKLLKLQKATESLNAAAGLLPAMSSASLSESIVPNAAEYEHELEQENLEVKILRGRNVAMKHKLLKLQKAIHCLSAAVGLLPATSSASLGKNIHLNASEHKHELEQKTLEMKILKERLEAMKCKLLKLHNANQSINVAADLIPAMPASISLGDNIDPNASEYEHQLELKSINHHASSTYQNLKNRMTRWIWSKVSPAYSEINAACHI